MADTHISTPFSLAAATDALSLASLAAAAFPPAGLSFPISNISAPGPASRVRERNQMLTILCFCPPALHPRTAALLGDTATLHFFSDSTITSDCAFKIATESVDRCYIELPDARDLHPTFLPEVMRVLKKGAKICVRHRSSMKWIDLFVFRCMLKTRCDVGIELTFISIFLSGFVDAVQRDGDGITLETTSAKPHWLN